MLIDSLRLKLHLSRIITVISPHFVTFLALRLVRHVMKQGAEMIA